MNQRIWVVVTMILCLCGSNAFAQNSFAQQTKAEKDKLKAQKDSLTRAIEKKDSQIAKVVADRKKAQDEAKKPIAELEKKKEEQQKRLGTINRVLGCLKPVRDYVPGYGFAYHVSMYGIKLVCRELGAYQPRYSSDDPEVFEQLDRIQARADAKILKQCGSGPMNEAAYRTADRIQAKANKEKKRLLDAKYPVNKRRAELEAERASVEKVINELNSKIYAAKKKSVEEPNTCDTNLFADRSRLMNDLAQVDAKLQTFPFEKYVLRKDAYTTYDEDKKSWMIVEPQFKKQYAIFDEKYHEYDLLHATVPSENGSNVHVYLIPSKYVSASVKELIATVKKHILPTKDGITENHMLPIIDGKNLIAIKPNFLFNDQKYYAVRLSQELTKERVMTKQEIETWDQLVLKKIGGTGPVYEYDGNYFVDGVDDSLIKYDSRGDRLYDIGKKEVIDLVKKKGRRVR